MPGLKPAARQFVKSVFDVLAQRAKAYDASHDGFPRWTSRGSNAFVLVPRTLSADEVCLSRETMLGSPDVPERARFRVAMAGDARLRPLIGQLVGTVLQAGRLDEAYLDHWAVELGVAELLNDARRDAAI